MTIDDAMLRMTERHWRCERGNDLRGSLSSVSHEIQTGVRNSENPAAKTMCRARQTISPATTVQVGSLELVTIVESNLVSANVRIHRATESWQPLQTAVPVAPCAMHGYAFLRTENDRCDKV